MKPKLIHQKAMDYSFEAKQSLERMDYTSAFELYKKAAELESQVAEFYFDKPELEPTRSVIIRSAAFMNLKAGLIEKAQKFIFFGLLNTEDELIKDQLNNALELSISLKEMPTNAASNEFNYLNLLRQRSVHYVIEPSNVVFQHSVSLEMIKEFSESYLKSLKAFALSKFKKIHELKHGITEITIKELEKLINPLITNSAYGSFKFSIANDFLSREGETKEILNLKANVVSKYHNEIFINPLNDNDIAKIKKDYTEEEVDDIFKPLAKIKSPNATYKVGYYDSDNLNKIYTKKIINKQRVKLLAGKKLSKEDIGELESSIIHKRSTESGQVRKTTILREHLKSYEFDIKTNQIEPKDKAPLILNEEILLNVVFSSKTGFTISFDDLGIELSGITYEKTLKDFYDLFYEKIFYLANTIEKKEKEQKDWDIVKSLIGNPNALKRQNPTNNNYGTLSH